MSILQILCFFGFVAIFDIVFSEHFDTHYEPKGRLSRENGIINIGISVEFKNVIEVQENYDDYLDRIHQKVLGSLKSEKLKNHWNHRMKTLKNMNKNTKGTIEEVCYVFGVDCDWKQKPTVIDESNETSNDQMSHDERRKVYQEIFRNKRAIGIDDIAMGFMGFGIGMSIWNRASIETLSDSMQKNKEDISTIVKHVKHTDLQVEKLNENVKIIKEIEGKLVDIAEEEVVYQFILNIYEDLLLNVGNHSTAVNKWQRAMNSVVEGRLDINLIDPRKLEDVMERVRSNIAEQDYNLMIPKQALSDVFKCKTSFKVIRDTKLVQVFHHVPISRGTHLKLFRYIEFPFQLDSSNVSMVLKSPNGNEFIAINEENTMSVEFSINDFMKCTQWHDVMVCPNTNLINRNMNSGCLTSIYMSNLEQAKKYCDVKLVNTRDTEIVKQLSETSIALFSTNYMTVTTSCDKQKDKNEKIQGFHIYTLNRTCSLITENHFFRPSLNFHVSSFISRPLEFHPSQIIDHIDKEEFNNVMETKMKLANFHEIDLGEIEKEIEKGQQNSEHSTIWYVMIPCLSILTVFVILVISFLVYRIHKNRQARGNG